MASKLRFGTRERIDYRAGKHVVIRRTHLSYDRLMQLCDAESQARDRGRREAWILGEHAQAVSNVLE